MLQGSNLQITANIIEQVLAHENNEITLYLFLYLLSLCKQHARMVQYEELIKKHVVHYLITVQQNSVLVQNNCFIIYEFLLQHFDEFVQHHEIYVIFGHLFVRRAQKMLKMLQTKVFKHLEEYTLMLDWFFRIVLNKSLIFQNFIPYNRPVYDDFIQLLFDLCAFQEVQVVTLKKILQNFDFTLSQSPNLNQLYQRRQSVFDLTREFNEEPAKFLKKYPLSNAQMAEFLRFNQYVNPQMMTAILGSAKVPF